VKSASFETETRIDDVSRLRELFEEPSIDLEPGGVVWFSEEVSVGPGVSFGGTCRLAGPVFIERGCVLTDARLGPGTRVRPYSLVRDFVGGARNLLGPFCFLRDGCIAGDDVILGAHVEATRSRFGSGTKISHRAFVGDAELGQAVIIGAGVVFCNYDGHGRQPSTIGAHATVGSGSLIVAPVRVGEHAIVAAGSVVTKDVPAHGKLLQRR
jgi:bifunctional UDP-N-acetylglucosamine pyrophosphorylase/glucosamine-1-phosphate N-acetyltransferase